MNRRNRRRIGVESLESRNLLAAAVTSLFGNLVVTDNVAADLTLTQTAADTWTVTDGGNPVGAGTFTGITGGVTVRTSGADDSITVALSGNSAKRLTIDAGGGVNQVSVTGGTVTQYLDLRSGAGADSFSLSGLTVNGPVTLFTGNGANDVTLTDSAIRSLTATTGDGDDTITLGDGVDDVTISRSMQFFDGGGANDLLTVMSGVTLGSLWTTAVNHLDLQSGSTVSGGVQAAGGYNVANSVTIDGEIGNLYYLGSGGADTITLGASGVVRGGFNAFTLAGDDDVNLQGDILGSLTTDTGAGNDSVTAAGLISRNAIVLLGAGNDFFEMTGQLGVAPSTSSRLMLDGGNGNDQVAFRAASQVNGSATINLGAGDDSLAIDDAALLAGAYVNAGAGNDTYYGTLPRTGLNQKQFESLLVIAPPF